MPDDSTVRDWALVREDAPNEFTPTGETFRGTAAEVEAYMKGLQAASGKCHGANALPAEG